MILINNYIIKVIVINDYKFGSSINEVIRSVLNFLFILMMRFHKHKKAQNHLQPKKKFKMRIKDI